MVHFYTSLSSLAVVAAVALALLFKLQSTSQPEELSYQRLQINVADPDGAVQHLAKVLSFPTLASRGAPNSIVNPEPFQQLHQYLQTTYATVYQRLKVELVHDFSLLFTWEGADPTLKPILLMSHLDVVPAPTKGPSYNWTYPPFSGTVADGYIWGRGALDVKIGVVSLLEAVTELLRQDFKPRRTIYLAFGHDEEVGGPYGAHGLALLLQSRGVQLELVLDEGGIVLSDGIKASGLTLVDKPLALIGTAEKGFETWELHITGTGGHSSMPPVGTDSVASRLSRVLADLLANPPPASLIHPVIDWTKAVGAAVRQTPLRLLLQNSDNKLLRPLLAQALTQAGDDIAALVRTTCGVVGIQAGGIADNVLPTSGTVKLNFRLLPGDNSSVVRQYLQSATHKHKEYVQIEALNPDENKAPDVTPSDGPHFQLIKQAIMETLAPPEGMVVAPYLLTGTTDSRYYGSVVPIAAGRVFRFLPQFLSRGEGDIRRIHGVDERVGVDDYLRGIGFYLRFIQLAASDASDEERAVA